MAATYRPVGRTCPSSCPLLNNGCYAQKGPVNIWQGKSKEINDELDKVLEGDCSVIRHHVSGDLFIENRLDTEYLDTVIGWHRRNPERQGYLYTHRIGDLIDAGYRESDLPDNLTVMASADDEGVVEEARAAGYRYTRIAESEEQALEGRKANEVVCPNLLAKSRGNSVTCDQCRICVDGSADVVFIKH